MAPATGQPSDRRRRDLRAILGDGVAFSIMVGAGETYVSAFALAIGAGEIAAGLVASVPIVFGALLQLCTPMALRRLGSHRRWVVACALVQAASFVPLAAAAARGAIATPLLFVVMALYWGAGLATGPAWNTWVGTLVPRATRAAYFAIRSRWCQLATVLSLVGAGLVLHADRSSAATGSTAASGADAGPATALWGFAAIFLAAGVSRVVSAAFLSSQSEPPSLRRRIHGHRHVPLRELLRRAQRRGDLRLVYYMLVVTLAVQVSGPYFAPYMLSELRFSYHEYLTLLAGAFVSKSLVLPTLGGLMRGMGGRVMLWIGGVGMIGLPWLWTLAESFWWLLIVQVISGTVWAAYELATFLLLFDHIAEEERTSVLTTYNVLYSLVTLVGALLGAVLLDTIGADREGYMLLFLAAVGARALTLIFLARVTGVEARHVALAVRTLAVRPATGGMDRPILAGFETDSGAATGKRRRRGPGPRRRRPGKQPPR